MVIVNNGKEMSGFEKPSDTEAYCELRKEWVAQHYRKLTCIYIPVCYIDEK